MANLQHAADVSVPDCQYSFRQEMTMLKVTVSKYIFKNLPHKKKHSEGPLYTNSTELTQAPYTYPRSI